MFVNFQDLTLIALSERFLSDKLAVYFRGSILITDSEEIVKNKLKNIIDTGKEINRTNRKNSAISEREQEVLRLVAFGFTNKQISDQLYISTHTVITHRKNISSKLGIKTIAGLTVYAIINGIISPDEML
ncbi:MAG: response regulator transcription factor [Bacteroidales bacterium]|nr:response regulator transcription factor [Bacteroidales bacterium]